MYARELEQSLNTSRAVNTSSRGRAAL